MKQTEEKYEVIPDGMNRFDRFTKRAFDILVSAVCLVAFSPLILFCYLAVKLEDGGPAVYKQERIGLHGKAFNILKFRSMRIDAEDGGPKLSSGETDNRLTKVGKMLREHHLDELPQLWNVFRGDMAFIGPRPERPMFYDEFDKYIDGFRQRLLVTPGLTGLAQVRGGYDLQPEQKIVYDVEYIETRSFRRDLEILFATVKVIFSHNGAR